MSNDLLNTQHIIKLAGEAGAKAALEALEKERKKAQKNRHDRRLRNTKLLLRNYRMLSAHCKSAIYDERQVFDENAIDVLDMMEDYLSNEDLYVESIKRSARRTYIIMAHINEMLRLFEIYCYNSGKPEDERRFRAIESLYITDMPLTVKEIAKIESIDERTVYKDIDSACEKLSALIFGIDGLSPNK